MLERVAAGDPETRLTLSPLHDELDAIAFGINVLADELRWTHARMIESERARANELREVAVRGSRANFETVFHANPCAMLIARRSDGRFQDANTAFERQTGCPRDEVIGRTLGEIGVWIDPDDFAAMKVEFRSAGNLRGRELRYRTRNGTNATCVLSTENITFNGEACQLAVGLDVTDRKNAELQAATLRYELAHLGRVAMLDVLSGSLAHELSQPLTAVMANAEAAVRLLNQQPPRLSELAEALGDIVNDNRRAADVLLSIRSLLKKGPAQYELTDMNAVVGEVLHLIQNAAIARRVAVDVQLAPDGGTVLGDGVQIQQVALNLLINAFDAVQANTVAERRVVLRTTRYDAAICLEIADYGAGLSDEALGRIFEPFYTTKQDGIGLGLSICRTLVDAHGGTLTAARNPVGGMTFTASFPLWRPQEATERPPVTVRRLERA